MRHCNAPPASPSHALECSDRARSTREHISEMMVDFEKVRAADPDRYQ